MDFLTRQREEILKSEVIDQICKFQSHVGRYSFQESEEKLRKSILQDEVLMNLYSKRDAEELLYDYLRKVIDIKNNLYCDEENFDYIVAKIYEYIRFTTVNENIISLGNKDYLNDLGSSSVSPLLMGKTTDIATARLMRDMLPNNVDSKIMNVNVNCKEHPILVASAGEKYYYLDPANYDGTPSKEDDSLIINYNGASASSVVLDENMINSARRDVSKLLIHELKIDTISEKIINNRMGKFDRICAILGYLETIIRTSVNPVSSNVVKINGKLMEVGKVMELFFLNNDIPYKFVCDENKDDSIYSIMIDGTTYSIDPSVMYNSYTGKITEKSLYKEVNGERKYLFELNEYVSMVYAQKLFKSYYIGLDANKEIFSEDKKGLAV